MYNSVFVTISYTFNCVILNFTNNRMCYYTNKLFVSVTTIVFQLFLYITMNTRDSDNYLAVILKIISDERKHCNLRFGTNIYFDLLRVLPLLRCQNLYSSLRCNKIERTFWTALVYLKTARNIYHLQEV